ncbi:MAG: DsbA family protein [Anaerolineaceae bacterium]|nr:DsbA family protein [Anaerolineaceae bacterium]
MPKRYRTKKPVKTSSAPNRKLLIGSTIVVALAIVALLVLPNFLQPEEKYPQANRNSIGDPNAPILVEEYSDFQCPWCARFALDSEPALIEKYVASGNVQFTFIPFSFLGPESIQSAKAAYCAADQNKFWEFKEKIYLNQSAENSGALSDANLERFASQIKLDMTAFRDCFISDKYAQQVQDDLATGQERGINGTPYFLVNGEGPYAAAELEIRIQAALVKIP